MERRGRCGSRLEVEVTGRDGRWVVGGWRTGDVLGFRFLRVGGGRWVGDESCGVRFVEI